MWEKVRNGADMQIKEEQEMKRSKQRVLSSLRSNWRSLGEKGALRDLARVLSDRGVKNGPGVLSAPALGRINIQ